MPKLTGSTKKIALQIHAVHKKDPKLSLKQISTNLGVDSNQARTYFKRHFGKSFTAHVREIQVDFVRNNQQLTNPELCNKLKIPKSRLAVLIKELKEKGELKKGRRKVAYDKKPPVAYQLSGFEVMRMLRWSVKEKGFSVPELKQVLSRSPDQIRNVLDQLISNKLVSKGKKIGKRQHYYIEPKGRQWINTMEVERVERDREHLKSQKGSKIVLERKEREIDAFLNLRSLSQERGIIESTSKLGIILGMKQKEISRLRLELYGKTK